MPDLLLSGEIVFADLPQLPPVATARIQLLDTTYADAAATVIAEQVLYDIADTANQGLPLPFALYGEAVDVQSRYTVSVHVDWDGGDRLDTGDYINTQSYPVLTHGYPAWVSVQVRPL